MTTDNTSLRPLRDRTVLIARPKHQASDLARLLTERGATVEFQPAIEIGEPDDWLPVDRALREIEKYEWVVFSSSNGVNALLGRIDEPQRLGSCRLAAIGPGTAARITEHGLTCELIPETYRAESLAGALAPHVAGHRVLLIRASRGREVLAERLRESGAEIEQVVVYSSRDVAEPDPRISQRLEGGTINWVAVTSSAIARSLASMFGPSLEKTQLAAVSPLTEMTLRECGFIAATVAKQYDMPGLVEAICQKETVSRRKSKPE